jgi:hypothetical protein
MDKSVNSRKIWRKKKGEMGMAQKRVAVVGWQWMWGVLGTVGKRRWRRIEWCENHHNQSSIDRDRDTSVNSRKIWRKILGKWKWHKSEWQWAGGSGNGHVFGHRWKERIRAVRMVVNSSKIDGY